jgi:hypothetical protein
MTNCKLQIPCRNIRQLTAERLCQRDKNRLQACFVCPFSSLPEFVSSAEFTGNLQRGKRMTTIRRGNIKPPSLASLFNFDF